MPKFSAVYKPRGYRHFDAPLSLAAARKLALNPKAVARHPFHPFIRRLVIVRKYKKQHGEVERKERPLAYAAHADAAIYSWYGAILLEAYEELLRAEGLESIPTAFRKFAEPRCNLHFAVEAFTYIAHHRPCVALCFDISKFFDRLNHRLLQNAWCGVLKSELLPEDHYKVYRSLTCWSWVDEYALYKRLDISRWHRPGPRDPLCSVETFREQIRRDKLIKSNTETYGIPQGSPMSGVLSNIYMLPFDRILHQFVCQCGGFVRRYCDDILVVVPPEWQEAAIAAVFSAANELRLTIQSEKTDEVVFSSEKLRERKPVQYLGLTFDGERVLLRPQTLGRFWSRVRKYLRQAAQQAAGNPVHPDIYDHTAKRRFVRKRGRTFQSYVHRAAQVAGSAQIVLQLARVQELIELWKKELTSRYSNPS